MTAAPHQADRSPHPSTSVVLLAPELFATPPDLAALRTMLTQRHPRARLLVRLAAPTDLAAAEALARVGAQVELLVPAGMVLPPTGLRCARMPPGSSESDTDELALALSDVLLVDAHPPDVALVRLARQLEKQERAPGAKLPIPAGARRSIAHRLDPEQPGWHRVLRCFWGRWEQFYLELAAFNWQGRKHGGIARSREKLRACMLWHTWGHTPYFAPEGPGGWMDLVPDHAAVAVTSPIVAGFNRLDRSALHGSYIHRDLA
jgi:hypothetical protein